MTKQDIKKTKKGLERRLLAAMGVLTEEYRKLFPGPIDYVNFRMLSTGGEYALQWVDSETTLGSVYLVRVNVSIAGTTGV